MKKPVILFIHGGGEGAFNADQKLVDSLKHHLVDQYTVIYPAMPHEDDPKYENFKPAIRAALQQIDGDVIFAGHSLGALFILRYITEVKIDQQLRGVFLASTPFWGKSGWQYEGFDINNELAADLLADIPTFFYLAVDDETVPIAHIELYRKHFTRATFREIGKGGHQLGNDLLSMAKDISAINQPLTPPVLPAKTNTHSAKYP